MRNAILPTCVAVFKFALNSPEGIPTWESRAGALVFKKIPLSSLVMATQTQEGERQPATFSLKMPFLFVPLPVRKGLYIRGVFFSVVS